MLWECGFAKEPRWQSYFKLLYPNAAKYQTVLNGEFIQLMEKRGDNVDAARRLNLHMFFPTEPQRLLFSEQARLSGFAIGDALYKPEQEMPYGVILHRVSTLMKQDLDGVTTRAIRLAEKYDGSMTYMDSASVPKRHPMR